MVKSEHKRNEEGECPLKMNDVDRAKSIIKMTMSLEFCRREYERIVEDAKKEGLNLEFKESMPEKDLLELSRRVEIQSVVDVLKSKTLWPHDMKELYETAISEAKREGVDLSPSKDMKDSELKELYRRVAVAASNITEKDEEKSNAYVV
jgi:hypothetical protein